MDASMKEKLIVMDKDMVKVGFCILMEQYMKAIMNMDWEKAKEQRLREMALFIMESGKMILNMEKGSLLFLVNVSLLQLGLMVRCMVKVQ